MEGETEKLSGGGGIIIQVASSTGATQRLKIPPQKSSTTLKILVPWADENFILIYQLL
jgi:hypothetical protein